MTFEAPGDGSLDYYPCRYGMSRVTFRGPRRDLDRPYMVTLGGAETYGKFVPQPYPALVEAATGLRVVNLGVVNAGLDLYLKDPGVLDLASRARLAVVQVVGAQNLSNRFYSVHARRNDRFLSASPVLRHLYREVDFTDFSFTRHMLHSLQTLSAERFEVVAEELRTAWVARMKTLLVSLPCPVVLLWVGKTPPPLLTPQSDLSQDPLLITADMVATLRACATCYVEIASDSQLRDTDGMAFSALEQPAALALPGPAVHRQIADQLAAEVLRLV